MITSGIKQLILAGFCLGFGLEDINGQASAVTGTLSLPIQSASAPASGTSAVFLVDTSPRVYYEASTKYPWLHVKFGSTYTGSAAVNYSVDTTTSLSARSGTIVVAVPRPGQPSSQSFTVNQAAAPVRKTLSFNPGSLVPSSTSIGSTSPAQTVQITNTGNSSVFISSIATTGANAADFAIQSNSCVTMAPHATCALPVVFTPSLAGEESAMVTITSDALESPQNIYLGATGRGATQPWLQITSPTERAIVNPGQTIAVSVKPSSNLTLREVYLIAEDPIPDAGPFTSSPYRISTRIPIDIQLGIHTITAIGIDMAGNAIHSDPLDIDVEKTKAPTSIRVEPSTLIGMDYPGNTGSLQVTGTFSDKTVYNVTTSSRTIYSTSNPAVATVSSDGLVTAVGPGSALIGVNGAILIPVTVSSPLTVVPDYAMLHPGQSEQFSPNSTDQAAVFSWNISPAGVGTISSSGLYTAPATIATKQVISVTATNSANSDISVGVPVSLLPSVSVAVAPRSATLGVKASATFAAVVANDEYSSGVNWSISPAGLGTIGATGVYTAPATLTPGRNSVTLTATSIHDPTKSATAVVYFSH